MTTVSADAAELSVRTALLQAFTEVAIESGICMNILQEMAHIAKFLDPPVFDVQRISGPDHAPTFKCTLKLGGINFEGEPAKKKQQAKKNAVMAALSPLKRSKISASSLDWSPSCSCGHGYMVLKKTSRCKGKPRRQFWVCSNINGESGCGRRIWRDQVLIGDIFHVHSFDTIDEPKEEFGKLMKLSTSIKCDVAKVHFAIDNLKEDHKLSASMDFIDELKGEFGKLSDSIKCDAAKVHSAIDYLKEDHKLLKGEFGKLSASMKCDVAKVHSDIDNLKEGHKLSASMDTIDELKGEFGKLSASIKWDLAKVHSDIDNVKEGYKLSASMDTIDELKRVFGKLSDSIKCDVAKVHFAIDNLKEGHKLSASMDAIELKEQFGKLSATIKCDVAQVSLAIDNLNEKFHQMSASMEKIEAYVSSKNLEEAISSIIDFFRSNYHRIFVGLIFVLFVNHIVKGKSIFQF